MIDLSFTRSVCISARKKGETGPQSAGWRYTFSGTKSDDEAIRRALECALRFYSDTHENFQFARADDNIGEVYDPEVRGGIRFEPMFEWEHGRMW